MESIIVDAFNQPLLTHYSSLFLKKYGDDNMDRYNQRKEVHIYQIW